MDGGIAFAEAVIPYDLIVSNGTLVTASDRRDVDIGIADGRFAAIVPRGELQLPADDVIDARGLHIFAGLIDSHVHFREPGLDHEETWLAGTRAAVMGGVTTVLEMPNTIPPTDTAERARAKLDLAARSAYCDFGLFGLLGESVESTQDVAGSGLVVGLKAFLGPTTGGLSAPDDDGLRRALGIAREAGLRVAFHAEDRSIVEQAEQRLRGEGRTDPLAHLESRPIAAEVAAIDRVGSLLESTGAAGHVLHVSSREGLEAVQRWIGRAALTCEVTPHHALLGRDVYQDPGLARVNPPVRGEPHSTALLRALVDGQVDMIASDHAPHLDTDRQRDSIWEVPAGFAGVENLLPLLLTHAVHFAGMSLERLAYVAAGAPARIWGLARKGWVRQGYDADLTLIDMERPGVIRAAKLHGKSNATPFEGWRTRGAAVATIVRGRLVMRDGELLGEPGFGQSVSRAA